MAQLKVLICGGGIAGNALAFWLSKLGHDITVIERFPSLRATGLQVDLRGHGIEVMRRMGLEPGFRAKSVEEQGLEVVDNSGRQRAYFPANKTGKGLQSFSTDFEIMRGDLCRLIYDATKDRVKYVFGTYIESFEENNSSVKVQFSDGKSGQFDLLVGADGQGSRTRKMTFGPDTMETFHSLGVYIGYFTIPREILQGEEYKLTSYIAPGGRLMFTRRHNPHEIQIYLASTTGSERLKNSQKGNIKEEKEAMAEIFQGAGWQTEHILQSLEDSNDFYCERLGLVKLESWSQGRVVLLGDAAYCPSATTGMGTTSSLVGAYILAGEISKHCGRPRAAGGDEGHATKDGLSTALKVYNQKFRPFMDQVQKGLAKGSTVWDWIPSTPLGIAFFNFLLGVAAFLRLNVFGKWIIREDVRGWTLPDYKEMVQGQK
ncbi:hypothetical protein SI65_09666 [Aspergillus cristatus]|uniref:FAD-binding domain-containing protein n=1 Tax=Aspergillus cristatus TaxID=573508 RepID=A0A1E3B1X6_ASPCR|nr:hypothetical protein SI65_09666 [Aspergillus cristatus]